MFLVKYIFGTFRTAVVPVILFLTIAGCNSQSGGGNEDGTDSLLQEKTVITAEEAPDVVDAALNANVDDFAGNVNGVSLAGARQNKLPDSLYTPKGNRPNNH
jgi:hypothetical protein